MERRTNRCNLGLTEVEQTAILVPDDKNGLYDIYDLANNYTEDWAHDLLEKIILKLASYEDTGLTPEQILEISDSYGEQINTANEFLRQCNHWEREAKKYCSQLGEIRILRETVN
jgi:hypothetical protein